ncbi:hypothetical protein E2C01_078355 [Portunus trituberculatus]|uniref:Rhodanese domain-containing protein n=1 Tax=Portunus trituberculatus TaxID=210409 RepID=A0A5B7IE38_PORTR|nr:hypothetical protein [Portunus trituberculatus]
MPQNEVFPFCVSLLDIEYEELAANLESFVVLDVRGRDEVKKAGQIPGSHCLPSSDESEFSHGLS